MIHRNIPTTRKQFGVSSLRTRIENAIGGVIFAATSLFFVGGAIALFLKDAPLVA